MSEIGRLYGFGLNNNGQISYDPKKNKIISKPSLIKSFKRNFMTNVQYTNNISFILNDKKKLLFALGKTKGKILIIFLQNYFSQIKLK